MNNVDDFEMIFKIKSSRVHEDTNEDIVSGFAVEIGSLMMTGL